MKKNEKAAAVLSICISSFILLSSPVEGSGLKGGKSGPEKTVFDLSHKEIFSPVETGPLNYSTFYESMRVPGAEVAVNRGRITAEALKGVDTYIIAGPSAEVGVDEAFALKQFVNNGGNLLVLLHISGPVARLTESFGIIVSNFVIAERENTINGQPQDFYVRRFAAHPVTAGVREVAVFGTWGIKTGEGGGVVAVTSKGAWADANRNRAFDGGEPVEAFGVVAVKEAGRGKVAVVADDAPFANRFIGIADNRKLADNITKWFRE